MQISKICFLILILSVSGCCCNKSKPELKHVSPNIKTIFPYRNGQVLRFIDSITNNKLTVNCSTESMFWVAGCELFECNNCQDFEHEEFKITLLSPDSLFHVNLITRSSSNNTSYEFKSNDFYSTINLEIDSSNNIKCPALDGLSCSLTDTVERLNVKNIIQIGNSISNPKADSLSNLKKIWITKNEGIVKIRFKNKTFYLDK